MHVKSRTFRNGFVLTPIPLIFKGEGERPGREEHLTYMVMHFVFEFGCDYARMLVDCWILLLVEASLHSISVALKCTIRVDCVLLFGF